MLPSGVPRSSDIAGKVFLLGEYAVLAGEPCLVAAVGPRFTLQRGEPTRFSPESPAGKLLELARQRGMTPPRLEFHDPHEGAGGFGASTAQFALLYKELGLGSRWEEAWSLYRELSGPAEPAPSGADLIAQWRGGVTFFDPSEKSALDIFALANWASVLVFSATRQSGRKTITHEHLASLPAGKLTPDSLFIGRLREPLFRGIQAVREGRMDEFGASLLDYAEILAAEGLEDPPAGEDRLALSALSGVHGVKGCGARLSDAVVVVMDPRAPGRPDLIRAAEARGLRLIADGLPSEWGVT